MKVRQNSRLIFLVFLVNTIIPFLFIVFKPIPVLSYNLSYFSGFCIDIILYVISMSLNIYSHIFISIMQIIAWLGLNFIEIKIIENKFANPLYVKKIIVILAVLAVLRSCWGIITYCSYFA